MTTVKPRDYYYYPIDGIKIEVRFVDIEGVYYKITQEYMVQKYSNATIKKIKERQKWKKFGDTEGSPTSIGDEVFLEFNPNLTGVYFKEPQEYEIYYFDEQKSNRNEILIEVEKNQEKPENTSKKTTIKCRLCGGSHWSVKCSKNNKVSSEPTQNKFKNNFNNDFRKKNNIDKKEIRAIKIDNLDQTVSFSDLKYILEGYGDIKHFHLVKDKHTGESAGYGFITYYNQEDAEYAFENISKKAIGYSYPSCEWSSNKYKT